MSYSELRAPAASRLAELMFLDRPLRPRQPQQPLVVIVAADVVTFDRPERVGPLAVGVPAEGEGDALRVGRQQLLDADVAGEGVPQETVQQYRQPGAREAQPVERRVVRDDDHPPDARQRFA